MREYELDTLENSSTFLIIDGMDDHSAASITEISKDVENILSKATDEMLQHLHQLKHSAKYGMSHPNIRPCLTRFDKLRMY